MKALKKHYKGKPFLPKSFTSENHIQELKGVYVPLWLFDGVAEGNAHYEATRFHTQRRGDKEITQTEHYDVFRAGSVAFEKIPVDASSKMPDDHMDSIEPYDYKELKPFSTAYLPGFLADRFDVSFLRPRGRQHPTPAGQGLPLCCERPDRQAGGRPAHELGQVLGRLCRTAEHHRNAHHAAVKEGN